jgi:hypothetical protein
LKSCAAPAAADCRQSGLPGITGDPV